MCEPNSLRLGDSPEQRAVAVEAPGPSALDELEPGLVVAIQDLVRNLAGMCFVRELERLGAKPRDVDDNHECVRPDSPDRGIRLKVFEFDHAKRPAAAVAPLKETKECNAVARGNQSELTSWSARDTAPNPFDPTKRLFIIPFRIMRRQIALGFPIPTEPKAIGPERRPRDRPPCVLQTGGEDSLSMTLLAVR